MIKVHKYPSKDEWPRLLARPVADLSSLEKEVRKIMKQVSMKGDKALRKFAHKFDGAAIRKIEVSKKEFEAAEEGISEELKIAIDGAIANIEKFHQSQVKEEPVIETVPGVKCWRRSVAIEKAGFYIPGGSAPLFSTVLMLAIPARIAGCRERIMCTPPSRDGLIHPAILFAAKRCGITRVFKTGGAQAIAAMAYGTETIPQVQKIFGPGNQYVTLAKQLVQQNGVAIDMPAGPSEVLVIADETADPRFVAADLLSQAEHGPDSQVILVSNSEEIIGKVKTEILAQLKHLSRYRITEKSLGKSRLILVRNIEEAFELSNYYAPEHLIIAIDRARELAGKVSSAGSVFIGNYSPESAGDYASGTNHTLPTNGYAAMYSGVSVDSFVKKITYQELNKEGLASISSTVMTMAEAEGLDAHKKAIEIRLK